MNKAIKRKAIPYLFLTPFLLLFAMFMVYPTLYSLAISFMRYKVGKFEWVGLANFKFLLSDSVFLKSIWNTFLILMIQVPIMTIAAVILASFLNMKRIRCKAFFRMFVFMPILIDAVSYSIVFSLFFNNNEGGLINGLLNALGAGPMEWMNNAWLAKIVIITAVTWRWTGYNMIIILGGLQNISADLYEAASIDGAGKIRQFFSITIPGVKPVLMFSIVLSVNGVLQLFTEPNLITHSGPSNETLTIVQYLYNVGFKQFNFGVSAAGAYILAIMVGVLTWIQLRVTREDGR
jgi:lactose/L-arabinose transport system permease protein